jgi:hypothetical protein
LQGCLKHDTIEEYGATGLIIPRNGEDFSKAVWMQSEFYFENIIENFDGTKFMSEKKNALLWRS